MKKSLLPFTPLSSRSSAIRQHCSADFLPDPDAYADVDFTGPSPQRAASLFTVHPSFSLVK
ncbi:MAG: hypothetical protein AAF828_09750 [Bacteroidota bacterium]